MGTNMEELESVNNTEDLIALREEVAQLKDLFMRRLLDDKAKNRLIDELTERLDGLHLRPILAEIILLLDRIHEHAGDTFSRSIADELMGIFDKYDFAEIATSPFFNPEYQKAVAVEEVSEVEDGTVLEIRRKGYMLNGLVVRPEEVVLAKQIIPQPTLAKDEAEHAAQAEEDFVKSCQS